MDPDLVKLIHSRLEIVNDTISTAAIKAGRKPEDVKLVVVTKAQSIETTQAAIEAGAKILGENYPQEAAEKISGLSEYAQVEWHMIGHLQSRKAKIIANQFHMIHSIDSVATAQNLDKVLENVGRRLPALLEINVGGEESKSGWLVTDSLAMDKIFPDIEAILGLKYLEVKGLMTMPPWMENPEAARPFFRKLAVIRDELRKRFPDQIWDELSMGTSADFMIAVEEGATYVRIGQAIVGPRPARV